MKKINCLECPQREHCCQEGVWVDLKEARKISSLGLPGEFYHLKKDKKFPSGYKVDTSYKDGPCSFLTADGLCSIHKVDYNLKPTYCKEFPYEDGKIAPLAKEFCLLVKHKSRNTTHSTSQISQKSLSDFLLKRIFLYFFVYFCISNSCYAAPSYGTKMPQKNHFIAGLQTHSVLKRYLVNQNGKMRSLQNFVLISYGFFDWLCIDLKAGAGNIKQQSSGAERIDYSAYLGGGYGFRMRLYDSEKTKAVFGFQHISIHPHKTHKNGIKRKVVLDDWQFSLLVSRDFSIITPYLATKWFRTDCILWTNGERSRIKSDRTKSIGLIVGVDIPLSKKSWLNIEGNFFDAEAFSTSLNFSF